jgi:branched-chain amino acid transport system ATP-binding protein
MTDEPMLAVDDVHTYYGEGYVLQGVSLSVGSRSIVAVLGRNGVGKTTLIRSVIAFTPPRRGRIRFDGVEVTRWPAYRIVRSGMGIVPQGRRVFPSLTVREHLEIAHRVPAQPETTAAWDAEMVLELFPPLRERGANRASTLSGGEQQMLAIARALIGNPRFLLMDEPTEGLSPFLVEDFKQLIKRLRQTGLAILLVEQNLDFALDVADYVYVMDKGKVVFESTPEKLASNEEIKGAYLGV